MNEQEYEYWCELCGRFNTALKAKSDAAKLVIDANDMLFLITQVEKLL